VTAAETYAQLLDRMYQEAIVLDCVAPGSKAEFVGNHIYDFTTYSGDLDVIFCNKMTEVIEAILNGTTFEYIGKSDEHHINYIAMCNMPFLRDKLEWGTSIRGAWLMYYNDNGNDYWEINFEKIPKTDIKIFLQALIDWLK
jgi:hypothetical protein